MAGETAVTGRSGLPYALGAYFLWGVMPLFIALLNAVDPFRLVAWRALWTVPLCLAALIALGDLGKLRAALADRRAMSLLLLSALLVSFNWVVYVIAVQQGHIYAASLGYYINPLVNVLLGTVFLRERLTALQWLAVGIAAIAIAILAFNAAQTLLISLALAISFGFYGLVRKTISVDSLPGLTIEVAWLAIPAIGILAVVPAGTLDFGDGWRISLLLAASGAMTAVPLWLFAAAARRMTYSALGFVQFLAPTMVFFSGLLIFEEDLRAAQASAFVLIWTAIALFCADILRRGRRRIQPLT